MCPKGSGPHSAAKQRRSFRVPPINHPQWLVGPRRSRPRSAAKQGRSFRMTPINSAPTRFSRGSPDLRIRKWTLECSCVPKGVGAAFCSKTAPFLSCAPNKPSAGLCARINGSRIPGMHPSGQEILVVRSNQTHLPFSTRLVRSGHLATWLSADRNIQQNRCRGWRTATSATRGPCEV